MEIQNKESEKTKEPLPEYMKMYEVSGQDAITRHSFERYRRNNEEQKKDMEYLALHLAPYRRELIQNAPFSERASLIRTGLENGTPEVQKECAMMIGSLFDNDQAELYEKVFLLIKNALSNTDAESQKTYAEMIAYAPKEKISLLIENGFETGKASIQKICATMIRHVSDDKKRDELRKKLTEIIRAGLSNGDEESGKIYASVIEYAADDHKASLVKTGIENGNPEIQNECASAVSHVPDKEKAALVEMIFANDGAEAKKMCAREIQFIPKEKRAPLLKIGLASDDIELQKKCASLIPYALSDEQPDLRNMVDSLIEKKFTEGVAESVRTYAEMIVYATDDKQSGFRDTLVLLAEKGFNGGDEEAKKIYASTIPYAPKEKIAHLVEKGMESGNSEAAQMSVGSVKNAPDDDKARLVEKGMLSDDIGILKRSTSEIYSAPIRDRARLISIGLRNKNTEIQKRCAQFIEDAPKEKQDELREQIFQTAKEKLSNGNEEEVKESAWMIRNIDDKKRAELIRIGLENGNSKIGKEYARMIQYAPQHEKKELLEIAEKTLGKLLVEPRLYEHGDISEEHFSRQRFSKTGSETILLGGSLKGNTIIRRIEIKPFLTWKKLYENHDLWKAEGFDYVPVEPIQSFKTHKDGLVDVYSGVLDLTYDAWEKLGGDFFPDLTKDRDKIKKVLRDNVIVHGHPHENNFCLRFWRDQNGEVDFSKKPRIYLIDFDEAKSFE
jgi:hypothetical protein